jgi:hypothetical protein
VTIPSPSRSLVLGIRHHGPGSARSVVAELDRVRPEIVLIEGPADADPVLGLAAAPGMEPPVALLAYDPAAPKVSAFWPYAAFSPEWQALTWALAHQVPARFCDLPAGMVLARDGEGGDDGEGGERDGEEDPLGALAAAAGYSDPERWWDSVVESRHAGESPFPALTEAMAELRQGRAESLGERRREAHMRQVLRAALKETDGPVAVVCGAWHAPALSGQGPTGKLPPASADAAVLRGTPRRKVALAWVPWTHSRLSAVSGYGAGITSPGWYHHLFTTQNPPGGQTVTRWLTRVAGVLRERDLPVSSAHVIEAVRLAETLAALRSRPLAGLDEVSEATRAVLCEGDDTLAAFVTRELVVGERLGSVPEDSPPVPLEADLRAGARRLKLKIDPLERALTLDLRRELDRERSVFLHRLAVLGIKWGTVTEDLVRNTGTFRETWSLRWRPELAVSIIDAAVWGTTVGGAATARLISLAQGAGSLPFVTRAVEFALLAALDDALGPVLRALDARAAADSDVADLMAAVPALVRAVRYGNVRGTPVAALSAVIDALVVRVCAGLPAAAGGLADEAATALRDAMDAMHAGLALHRSGTPRETGTPHETDARARWLAALAPLPARRDVHGLIAGRVTRMLADAGELPWPEAAARFGSALSAGVPPVAKGAWAEGFLAGGGLLLVHDRDLLGVIDSWLGTLDADDFMLVLPLLRRTFGEFDSAEREGIGRAVRRARGASGDSGPASGAAAEDGDVDAGRAAGAVRTVAAILGGAA